MLFMAGSLLFAIGTFPAYAQLVDPGTVGITFVVGSLFFTSAGYSAFLQAINPGDGENDSSTSFRFWAWRPASMLWWSTFVQLVGTLFFNFNTIDAMFESLSTEETNRLVWAPDFFGSIAFLIASHLAWLLVCHRIWCVQRNEADWWIAAFTLPTTGEAINVTIVNTGTFVGAVCFFIGAYLLLPPAGTRSLAVTEG